MGRELSPEVVAGAIFHLSNWSELFDAFWHSDNGAPVSSTPALRFRNGLVLQMSPKGFAGFGALFPEIFLLRCYEPTPEFVIRDGYSVVDLGANMGFFSCRTARAAKNVKIVAVEPLHEYTSILAANVAANRLSSAITIVEAAIAGRSGDTISLPVYHSPSGELMMTEHPDEHATSISVPTVSLASVLERGGIDRCDLLKVDVEGGEYDFVPAVQPETWSRIDRVVMEIHNVEEGKPNVVVTTLEANGFRVSRGPINHCAAAMLWATRERG
jgi:FkbM family methyltransferase